MSSKVGSKGQVVIEKGIRDRLGVRPGWQAVQVLADDHVEIYFIPPEHNRSLMGSLAPYVRTRPAPNESWDDIRDRAWRAAIQDAEYERTPDAESKQ
jgi:AbrB family looped-hinge helix DNA binding protein